MKPIHRTCKAMCIIVLLLIGHTVSAQKHMPEIMLYAQKPVIKVSIPNLIYFFKLSKKDFDAQVVKYGYKTGMVSDKAFEKYIGDKLYAIEKGKGAVSFYTAGQSSMVDSLKKRLLPYFKGIIIDEDAVKADGTIKSGNQYKGMSYLYKYNGQTYIIELLDGNSQMIMVRITSVVDSFHADEVIER